jgi:hypothetical protein
MNKDFCKWDIINSKSTLINEITSPKENLNLNNDDLSLFRKEQEEYYSENFSKGLEQDNEMEFHWYGNESIIFEINQDTDPNNSENFFPNFGNINNNPQFDSPSFEEKSNPEETYTALNINPNFRPDEPKKKEVKFNLINKKRGRKSEECENIEGEHTKNAPDNIERKVKVRFYDSTLDCSNELIKTHNDSQNRNEAYPLLKDIDSQIKKQSSKTENLKLLDNTVKDMLYEKISSKFKNFPPDYNIKLIDKIYQEGKAKEVISFLDTKVLLLYKRFIEDDKTSGKFKTLACHIERMKEKEKKLDKDYLDTFISTAKNFEANTREKKSRKRKKKNMS